MDDTDVWRKRKDIDDEWQMSYASVWRFYAMFLLLDHAPRLGSRTG